LKSENTWQTLSFVLLLANRAAGIVSVSQPMRDKEGAQGLKISNSIPVWHLFFFHRITFIIEHRRVHCIFLDTIEVPVNGQVSCA
jgi:hypothetical protein